MTYSFSPKSPVYRTTTTFSFAFAGIGSTTQTISIPIFATRAQAYITGINTVTSLRGGGPLYEGGLFEARQAISGTEKVGLNLVGAYTGVMTSLRASVGASDLLFGSSIYLSDFYIDNPTQSLKFIFTKTTAGAASLEARAHIVVVP